MVVTLAEWLRRWPAKPLCSARVGSNPTGDEKCTCTIFLTEFFPIDNDNPIFATPPSHTPAEL